jgi:hypothetical protein
VTKRKIQSDVEWAVPNGGSGVIVVFEEQWVSETEKDTDARGSDLRNHLHDDDVEENATP